MPRIIVAECKQEVSSFNPVASHYEDFAISFGNDIFDYTTVRYEGVTFSPHADIFQRRR